MNKSKKLNSFVNFRAIAILLIVAGHSFGHWVPDGISERALFNFIGGNTALFVFISGFFFHHVFFTGFRYQKFIWKKTRQIIFPYLFLSLSYMLILIVLKGEVPFPYDLGGGDQFNLINVVLMRLLTGWGMYAYWYIPFGFLLFLSSPFFLRFILLKRKYAFFVMIISFVISGFLQRPEYLINPIQSLFFYIPFYMLGISYSMHKAVVDEYIRDKIILLSIFIIAILALYELLDHPVYKTHANVFQYNGFDLMVLLKVASILWFIALINEFLDFEVPVFKYLADMSFGIFFLHAWVLGAMWHFDMFGSSLILALLTWIGVVFLCVVAIWFVRKLLGNKSRFFIGA